jgi:hypothetical protein
MLIRHKDGKEVHVQNEVGRALVAANLATEILSTKPTKPMQPSQWAVGLGRMVGDYECPPYIYAYCPNCGFKQTSEGPTAHKTCVFRHCGLGESVPAHIQREYEVALNAYKAKSRKKPKPAPVSDKFVHPKAMATFGLKSSDELKADLQTQMRQFADRKK